MKQLVIALGLAVLLGGCGDQPAEKPAQPEEKPAPAVTPEDGPPDPGGVESGGAPSIVGTGG